MISTNPFMDFFKNVFDFVFVNTLQVWHGKASFVQGVLRTVNLAALFLIFLASSVSWERCPSWRNDMIGVIQLFVLWIASVEIGRASCRERV